MNLLLTAATSGELSLLLNHANHVPGSLFSINISDNHKIDVLITGVGIAATSFHLTRLLSSNRYDLVVQAGIAGAFDRNLNIGETVIVGSDRFGQMGAQDDEQFFDVFELGLSGDSIYPYYKGWLEPELPKIVYSTEHKIVSSITVETVHGNERAIEKISEKYHPQIESMEGAAFYFCCMHMHIPCLQIRSISNYVEKRNKANWNIPLAVNALHSNINNLLLKI